MGRGHPHDLRWPTEECADDAKTQGKRSARKCRLATREESPNGGAKWRLAGGERRGVSSRHWGESDGKRKLQLVLPFLYEKKRERERGRSRSRTSATVSRWLIGLTGTRRSARCLVLIGLARDAVSLKPTRATVPPGRAQFIKPNTFLFSKLTKICKL
jgi:hypothetical protein